MLFVSKLIAQAAEAAAPVAEEAIQMPWYQKYGTLLVCVAVFGLMYFLMIRPQKKRQEAQQKMQGGVKAGDKVMTVNGAIGVVSRVADKTVWINFGKVEIEYVRAAIAEVIRDDVANAEAK